MVIMFPLHKPPSCYPRIVIQYSLEWQDNCGLNRIITKPGHTLLEDIFWIYIVFSMKYLF